MLAKIRRAFVSFGERQRRALRAQSGQSIVILAFAFLGLIAMLGLALDLGLVYIERVRIKRAVDAATLAGVVELPFEEDSFTRAIEYLNLNGYNIDPLTGDSDVYVVGCIEDPPGSGTFVDHPTAYPYIQVLNPRNVFTITAVTAPGTGREDICDKEDRIFGNASRLAVTGTVTVDMNFMQFFGFGEVPVIDWAMAQNVTDLDVVVVFDISGSMEFSTICYDCWVRTDPANSDYPNNGYYNPIPASVPSSDLCTDNQAADSRPYVEGGNRRYLIAEAELAASNPPLWETRYRQTGQGYWAIQRGSRFGDYANRAGDPSQQSSNVCLPGTGVDCTVPGNSSDDLCVDNSGPGDVFVDCSGYISHHPFATYGQEAPPAELLGRFYYVEDTASGAEYPSPKIEYDFTPDWSGNAYIWLRAQGGGDRAYELPYQDPFLHNKGTIHWAVFFPASGTETTHQANTLDTLGNNRWRDNRAEPGEWRWIRLNDTPISVTDGEPMILRLWAGSPGYDIDKIVVTNDSRSNWSSIDTLTYGDPAPNIGRPATPGSATREACDPCNPIYGLYVTPDQCTGYANTRVLTPTNRLANPLFGDLEPIRTSKEAVKRFVQRLEPEFDQAGFVPFTTDVERYDQAQLSCRKRDGQACFESVPPVPESPISYTQVLASVEEPTAVEATDIAQGMRNALEVLGVNVRNLPECGPGQNPYEDDCFDNSCDPDDDRTSCGRGGAASRVMVVLTDGSPNQNPGGCGNDPVYNFPLENDNDYDCVIYYAGQALNNNVVVYTIGLGDGARDDLLKMAAETARGQYFYAPTPEELDAKFDEILQNIYVRLIR